MVVNERSFHAMASPATETSTGDDKRESILEAALSLFAERGFHGTAVPLVSQKAKVAAGTIYRYFTSKEALVNALYRREKKILLARILQDFPFEKPPREQHRWFFERAAQWARERPMAVRFLELHHHESYLDEESKALEQQGLSQIESFFAVAAGAVKPYPPAVLGAVVWGAFCGLIRAFQTGHLELDDETVKRVEQCCWEAIRA
jgi:AcrR family transcriptional regulator